MALFSVTLVTFFTTDLSYPKPPHFRYFVSPFISSEWLEI